MSALGRNSCATTPQSMRAAGPLNAFAQSAIPERQSDVDDATRLMPAFAERQG